MKKIYISILGVIPWIVGLVLYRLISTVFSDTSINLRILGIIVLFFWGVISYILYCKNQRTIEIMTLLNAPAFIALILILIERSVLKTNWSGVIGLYTGYFYFPTLSIGCLITDGSGNIYVSYYATFVLMVLVSYASCYIAKEKSKKNR